jgi:hypothetical protein
MITNHLHAHVVVGNRGTSWGRDRWLNVKPNRLYIPKGAQEHQRYELHMYVHHFSLAFVYPAEMVRSQEESNSTAGTGSMDNPPFWQLHWLIVGPFFVISMHVKMTPIWIPLGGRLCTKLFDSCCHAWDKEYTLQWHTYTRHICVENLSLQLTNFLMRDREYTNFHWFSETH